MSEPKLISLHGQFSAGAAINNAWLTMGDVYLAEIVASGGCFDSVTLDMQHGLLDQKTVCACIRAIQGFGAYALVRLPKLDPALIGLLLDFGIDGLIMPQTNSVEEAEQFVAACFYPPRGIRSHGPNRVNLLADRTLEGAALFCMIETMAGLEAVAGIAEVEGLTGLFIGPGDLGIALGLGPGQDRSEPKYLKAKSAIQTAASANEKIMGVHANTPEYALEMVAEGFQLVTTWVDSLAVQRSINEAGRKWRQGRSE
ncbi:MAG: aldolase/citrate lyase family protein [Pirellulaceae bacterium]|nr:aldolase/citrate lyase family protein [Pirellulaceae bacterium]